MRRRNRIKERETEIGKEIEKEKKIGREGSSPC